MVAEIINRKLNVFAEHPENIFQPNEGADFEERKAEIEITVVTSPKEVEKEIKKYKY